MLSKRSFNSGKIERPRPGKIISATAMSLLLVFGQTAPVLGNPTGGQVVSGSATIGSAGKTLTINQSSNSAIINWQQFSINAGELTKFIVPTTSSTTLNRILGGNPSAIYGTLQSNGQLFIVNPNGIVVGAGGRVDTAGFLGSTLDVSNDTFVKGGNLNFVGSSEAGVANKGTIHASNGDVYLIAKQVDNSGRIEAGKGNVGLAAGSDILFQQAGTQHLFVQSTPTHAKRATGVTNTGTVLAASAELRAAGGNAYALAINNTGHIAATGYKKINGQVFLTSDGGSIVNSGLISARTATGNGGAIVLDGSGASTSGLVRNGGVLDTSSLVAKGRGGSILLKNKSGTVANSGTLLARGGQGGLGGNAEISGAHLGFSGLVDLTAAGGKTGNLLLDPATLNVVTGGSGTVSGGENNSASSIDPTTVETALGTANLTLNADTNITVTNGITWSSTNTLTLSTNTSGSTINLNAPISGINGGLTINTKGASDAITPNDAVNVGSFVLENGSWTQNTASLPSFTAAQNFELENGSSFLRVTGGNGGHVNPYQITDIYGLQGLASPSGTFLSDSAELVNSVSAVGTNDWNGGAGFAPIGNGTTNYTGTFDGQGFVINGLCIDAPSTPLAGLFGETGSGAVLENVGLTNVNINGFNYIGGLVGMNAGGISNVYTTGSVSGTTNASQPGTGGLVGYNTGSITDAYSSATVTGLGSTGAVGGLIGNNAAGAINTSYSSGAVISGNNANSVGGFVGTYSGGTINNCYSIGSVTVGSDSDFVGGFAGAGLSAITNCYSSGAVSAGSGSINVGGLVGDNSATLSGGSGMVLTGTITNSFWDTDTSGQTTSAGGTGESTANLLTESTYTSNGSHWNMGTDPTSNVWLIFDGKTRPLLAMEYSTTITNGHQLQLIGINDTTLTANYTLANNIDLTGTANPSDVWGTSTTSGAGFVPIGYYDYSSSGDANSYTGTFNGSGFTINGLYINAPSSNSGVGLFGDTGASTVENVTLTGVNVTGDVYAGGLIGVCNSTVTNTSSTGTVTGVSYVGGLLGISSSSISNSFSGGSVTSNSGASAMGGLIGYTQGGSVTASYSTASVTSAGDAGNDLGGLIGTNDATITQSYATGQVQANGGTYVGGLVGYNEGPISNSYSTGSVAGGNIVGGLAGVDQDAQIANCYSIGAVSGSSNVGGLLGENSSGTVADSYFSTDGSGQSVGIGSNGGTITYNGTAAAAVTGYTTAQMKVAANFDSTWDFTNIWSTNGDTTTPELIGVGSGPAVASSTDILDGTAFTDGGVTIAADTTVDFIFDGTLLGTATTNSHGVFTFDVSSTDLMDGLLLTDATHNGDTYYQSNAPSSTVSGVNIFGNTLRVSADVASNAALAAAASSFSGVNYTVSGADLTTNPGIGMLIVSQYTLDGNITASGALITSPAAVLSGSTAVTLTGSSVTLAGKLNTTGALTLASTTGAIDLESLGSASTAASAASFTLNSTGAVILNGSFLSTNGGNISATGTGFASTTLAAGTSQTDGVDIFGSTLNAQGGTITLQGTAGYAKDTSNLFIGNGVNIGGSTLETTGTGGITITGNGPTAAVFGANSFGGVNIGDTLPAGGFGAGSTLTTVNGKINVTGTVSKGTVGTASAAEGRIFGVAIVDTTTLQATGAQGSIALTGNDTGSTAFSADNIGVVVNGSYNGTAGTASLLVGTSATPSTGAGIVIQGTGGKIKTDSATTRAGADGFELDSGGNLTVVGSAPINITGTGGVNVNSDGSNTGNSTGINLSSESLAFVTVTTGGNIILTGTGGAGPNQGIGVLVAGLDGENSSVQASGSLTITGTGGGGYTGTGFTVGSYIPNSGIAIVDNVSISAGSVSLTGSSKTLAPGVDIEELSAGSLDFSPLPPDIQTPGNFFATATNGAGLTIDGGNIAAHSATLGTGSLQLFSAITSGTLTVTNSLIGLTGGDFLAYGAGDASSTDTAGNPNGIVFTNATINANGGNITLRGKDGYLNSNGLIAGIAIDLVDSNFETTNSGAFSASAYTGLGSVTVQNDLYALCDPGSFISTVNGDITLVGTVASGKSEGEVYGVQLANGNTGATGTGSVSISGTTTGSTGSESNIGVDLVNTAVSQANPDAVTGAGLTIVGTAGSLADEQPNAAADGVEIEGGVTITASGATPITITGTGGTDTNTNNSLLTHAFGINVSGTATLISSLTGPILLTGTGGTSPVFSGGVEFAGTTSGAIDVSGGSGDITIDGSMPSTANTSNRLEGVDLTGTSLITSGAIISITGNVLSGTANTGSLSSVHGVVLGAGSTLTGGTGTAVSLVGNTVGSTAAIDNTAVLISGGAILDPGVIAITGTAGSLAGSSASDSNLDTSGVRVQAGSTIQATDSGTIALTGTGGADRNTGAVTQGVSDGVVLYNAGTSATVITSVTGAITLTGIGGSSPGEVNGVSLNSNGGTIDIATDSGPITITGSVPDETVTSQQGLSGVFITGTSGAPVLSEISSGTGAIDIQGTVASGTAVKEAGVLISGGSQVDAGSILSVTGNTIGSIATSIQAGVIFSDTGTLLTAAQGMTITGTGSTLNGTTGAAVEGSSTVLDPATVGVGLIDGATLNLGSNAPLTIVGTGGANNNSNANSGSFGVAMFNNDADETTAVNGGNETVSITGTSGASAKSGIGVVLGGAANQGVVNLTTAQALTLTGTGGSGNSNGAVPNSGLVANAGTGFVVLSSNDAPITLKGTAGSGESPGIALSGNIVISGQGINLTGAGTGPLPIGILAESENNEADLAIRPDDSSSPATVPELAAGNDALTIVSTAGLVELDVVGGAGNTSVTTPLGTGSIFQGAFGPLSLSGGAFTVTSLYGVTLATVAVQSLTLDAEDGGDQVTGPLTTGSFTVSDSSFSSTGLITSPTVTLDVSGPVSLGPIVATHSLTIDGSDQVVQTGALTTGLLTLPSGNNVVLTNTGNDITALGDIDLTSGLSIYSDSALTIAGRIAGNNPVLIQAAGHDLTIGSGGQVDGSTVTLVTDQDFINDSTAGGNAILASTAYDIYSQDPTTIQLGGLTPDFTVSSAPFPTTSSQTGNGVFYASAGSNPPPPPPPPPNTSPVGSPGDPGSPVGIVTTVNTPTGGTGVPPGNPPTGIIQPVSYTPPAGTNGGTVGGGDTVQVGDGGVDNVHNPAAANVLSQALGPQVRSSLANALADSGTWTDDQTATAAGNETILNADDVVQISDGGGVKSIPLSDAPQPLQDALGNGVKNGLQTGTGH